MAPRVSAFASLVVPGCPRLGRLASRDLLSWGRGAVSSIHGWVIRMAGTRRRLSASTDTGTSCCRSCGVTQTGVQLLTAFLLSLPLQQRFDGLQSYQTRHLPRVRRAFGCRDWVSRGAGGRSPRLVPSSREGPAGRDRGPGGSGRAGTPGPDSVVSGGADLQHRRERRRCPHGVRGRVACLEAGGGDSGVGVLGSGAVAFVGALVS
jgi:hypothetical protein